jgi:hypothetical protein
MMTILKCLLRSPLRACAGSLRESADTRAASELDSDLACRVVCAGIVLKI